jgi:hypothetical protein
MFWNLWTFHLFNFPNFFWAAVNRGYWIRGYRGPPVHMCFQNKLSVSHVSSQLQWWSVTILIVFGKSHGTHWGNLHKKFWWKYQSRSWVDCLLVLKNFLSVLTYGNLREFPCSIGLDPAKCRVRPLNTEIHWLLVSYYNKAGILWLLLIQYSDLKQSNTAAGLKQN